MVKPERTSCSPPPAEYKIADVWADPAVDGMDKQWHRFAVAGRDEGDRQIMWIQGSPEDTRSSLGGRPALGKETSTSSGFPERHSSVIAPAGHH